MRPHFRCLLCLVAKSACSAPGKPGRFAAGTMLCAIQGPAVCSRVTGATQAVPVASAVETAVCPPSVMAEMCGRLPPNSMTLPKPPPTHNTHNSRAMRHACTTVKGMQPSPMISGPEWAMHHSVEQFFILSARLLEQRLYLPNLNLSCTLHIKRFVHALNSKWFIV